MAAGRDKIFASTTDSFILEQIFPRTTQRLLQSKDRRQKNIHTAGFNFLNGANVQIHPFSQLFLGQRPGHSLPAKIDAEGL
jgi:hypothetical protein